METTITYEFEPGERDTLRELQTARETAEKEINRRLKEHILNYNSDKPELEQVMVEGCEVDSYMEKYPLNMVRLLRAMVDGDPIKITSLIEAVFDYIYDYYEYCCRQLVLDQHLGITQDVIDAEHAQQVRDAWKELSEPCLSYTEIYQRCAEFASSFGCKSKTYCGYSLYKEDYPGFLPKQEINNIIEAISFADSNWERILYVRELLRKHDEAYEKQQCDEELKAVITAVSAVRKAVKNSCDATVSYVTKRIRVLWPDFEQQLRDSKESSDDYPIPLNRCVQLLMVALSDFDALCSEAVSDAPEPMQYNTVYAMDDRDMLEDTVHYVHQLLWVNAGFGSAFNYCGMFVLSDYAREQQDIIARHLDDVVDGGCDIDLRRAAVSAFFRPDADGEVDDLQKCAVDDYISKQAQWKSFHYRFKTFREAVEKGTRLL